jgi:hypothetical protein
MILGLRDTGTGYAQLIIAAIGGDWSQVLKRASKGAYQVGSTFPRKGALLSPASLRLSHDDARAEFVRATMEGGEVAFAAKRLALMCLPHFEAEEEFAFPALRLLPDLMKGLIRPEMAQVLALITKFSAKHDALDKQHDAIRCAIDALLNAARIEGNREAAEFALNMRSHERTEDEVIYPTVMMIGAYLRERLAA